MANKPRHFRVVPVPGTFTRGRWECWDYGISTSSSAKNLTKLDEEGESNTIGLLTTGGSNVVAIDNKIEQAMDLVKTHLTFAVREEVEQLKSTIADLEERVSLLENENQLLKQYAPVDIVANLGSMLNEHQTNEEPLKVLNSVGEHH